LGSHQIDEEEEEEEEEESIGGHIIYPIARVVVSPWQAGYPVN
jgi:hypothetical protein